MGNGVSELNEAAKKGDLQRCEQLLTQGAKVDGATEEVNHRAFQFIFPSNAVFVYLLSGWLNSSTFGIRRRAFGGRSSPSE